MSFTFKLTQGDSASFRLNVTEDTAPYAAFNLTGCTLFFTLKESNDQDDASALIKKDSNTGGITISNAATGEAVLYFANADTQNCPIEIPLVCDVQLKTSTGEIFTVASGKITFRQQTTRRTS